MNKYQKKISEIYNLSAYLSLIALVKSVINSLADEYFYYKTGSVTLENLARVLTKFDDYYSITETSLDRISRHERDQVTVQIKLLRVDHFNFFYILMARKGKNGNSKHLFFERETYSDARMRKHGIKIDNYEIIRVNNSRHEFTTDQSIPKNEVWTLQLSSEYKRDLLQDFEEALQHRNWNKISQICYKMSWLVPFNGVRQDYIGIRKEFISCYKKTLAADKVFSKRLHHLHNLPVSLPKLRRIGINEVFQNSIFNLIEKTMAAFANQRTNLMVNLANFNQNEKIMTNFTNQRTNLRVNLANS